MDFVDTYVNLPAGLRHDDDKDTGVQGFLRQVEEFGMVDEAADITSLTDKQRIALSLGTRMCAFTHSTIFRDMHARHGILSATASHLRVQRG